MRRQLTGTAKALRRNETNSEERLWQELRNRQLDGWKFKRQVPYRSYILDFFCFDASLVIEIDGCQHFESEHANYDERRTAVLEKAGLRVLRFTNSDVLSNMDGVLEEIYLALGQRSAPSPGAVRRARAKLRDGAAPASPQGERRVVRPEHDQDS